MRARQRPPAPAGGLCRGLISDHHLAGSSDQRQRALRSRFYFSAPSMTTRRALAPCWRVGSGCTGRASDNWRMTAMRPLDPDESDIVVARTYNDARAIGEAFRERGQVVMDLRSLDTETDGRRLLDFAAGATFALRGSIEKITEKVFFLSLDRFSSPELRRRYSR
ncbi:cell division protein SepF [Frankia sp. CNm7]|nr:cell division protein SepF [Frankia nepalensis]MBL7512423.1 cell division protein SepF [Frankia nepalensis]MBL7516996.1 cell division protein SepF [Frankia nepalensis]